MRTNIRSRTLFPNNILKNSRNQVYKRKEEPSKFKKKSNQFLNCKLTIYIISKLIITVDFLIITSNNERGEVKVKGSSCSSTTSKFLLSSLKNDRLYSIQLQQREQGIYHFKLQWRRSKANAYAVFKEIKQDKVEPIMPLHVRIQESDTCFFLFSTFWPYIHHIYSKYCNTYYF